MIMIGVDAGATKTEAVSFSASGERLLHAKKGIGNMVVRYDDALKNISEAIKETVPPSAGNDELFICIGAAGADTGENRSILRSHIGQTLPGARVRVMNDGNLALYASHGLGDGIVAIGGTGSVFIARRDAVIHRVGGWGHLLGDEGSGYDTVKKAFCRLIARYEAKLPYDALSEALLSQLNTDVYGAVDFFYSAAKGDIAAFMPIVTQLADSGDEASFELLREAGESLADSVIRLYRYTAFHQQVSVRCIGSVFKHAKIVREAFIACLKTREKQVVPDMTPVLVPEGVIHVYYEELPNQRMESGG